MIRRAAAIESDLLLEGDDGFVAEEGGGIVAHVAFNVSDGMFYAHSAFSMGSRRAFAGLVQAMRMKASELGFDRVWFVVGPGMPALIGLTRNGRARVEQRVPRGLLLSMAARHDHD